MKPKDILVEREILALSKELYVCKPTLSEQQFILHLREILDIYEMNTLLEVSVLLSELAYSWDGRADSMLVDEIYTLSKKIRITNHSEA